MKIALTLLLFFTFTFADDLGWSHDYKATQHKALKSGKLIYTLITSESCRWCRKFESTTLQDKKILKRLYEEFEVVHISRDKDFVPKEFETSPVPRHYFTTAQGEIVYSSLGHRGVECFESFMDNAHDDTKTDK